MKYWILLISVSQAMVISGCQNRKMLQEQSQLDQVKEKPIINDIASERMVTNYSQKSRKGEIEIKSLREQIKALESKIERLVEDCKRNQSQIGELQRQLSATQSELEKLKNLLFKIQRLDKTAVPF